MKKILSRLLKHKKPLVILACAGIICTAVYTGYLSDYSGTQLTQYLYNSNKTNTKILGQAKLVDNISDSETNVDASNYFSNAIINRERSRDEALEALQVVVDSSESMPDVKDKALSEMMQIAKDIETEATIEEMIKAKGYEDCLAIITGENINVIVKSPGLLTSDIAKITEIVCNETNFSTENIRIVEKTDI
jgi:stage III sporulation protein AH